MLIEDCDQIE